MARPARAGPTTLESLHEVGLLEAVASVDAAVREQLLELADRDNSLAAAVSTAARYASLGVMFAGAPNGTGKNEDWTRRRAASAGVCRVKVMRLPDATAISRRRHRSREVCEARLNLQSEISSP